MKKLLLTIGFVILATAQVSAQEPEMDKTEIEYENFTKTLANNAIKIVMSSDTNEKQIEEFKTLFMENCDLKYIGKFVLGQYWKGLDEAEREDFLTAFTDSVIMNWALQFNTFDGGTLEINSVTKSENPNSKHYFVNSTMKFTNGMKPAEVIWRERKDSEGKIKAIDIIIEGISMAMSYRNEYRSVLQRSSGDISGLITSLNEKTQSLKSQYK